MPTTTNYGWTTPADTDLVKDGAAAIRTLGSSIDTSVKSLNAGTTAGDIDYYTSATAKARLGIGSSGQVLTVAAGVPSWATSSSGGMTLLSTTTLSGATVTISSISQSYNNLYGVIYGVTNATANGLLRIAPNGTTNITDTFGSDGTGTTNQQLSAYMLFAGTTNTSGQSLRTDSNNAWQFTIFNYASTAGFKPHISSASCLNASSARAALSGAGAIRTASAITSLVISNDGGNLSTGTLLLYGVK